VVIYYGDIRLRLQMYLKHSTLAKSLLEFSQERPCNHCVRYL